MKRILPRRSRRRGATIVEATLILMLFLTIVFTIFDFAFVTWQHQTLVHQVRTAARYGVTANWNCTAVDCIDYAAVTAVKNVLLYGNAAGTGTALFGLTPSNIQVTKPGVRHGANEQIVISLSGYRYTLLNPLTAGIYTGRPITVSLPMEEYEP